MPQPLIRLNEHLTAPTLHIAPANGFVPETYLPMLQALEGHYQAISLPPQALWGDGAPPTAQRGHSWLDLADDLLAALDHYDCPPVIGFGHSIGAVTTLYAAIQAPQRFRALILCDPVVLPPPICDWFRQEQAAGRVAHAPLVDKALSRRTRFPSAQAAFDHFHGRAIFADWSDDVLWLYCQHGTMPCDDQPDERCLRWSSAWEAFYYATYYADIWQELPKLASLDLPMLFIAGGTTDTYIPETAAKVAQMLPDAAHQTLAGYGHLFPQAAPHATATLISDWLIPALRQ